MTLSIKSAFSLYNLHDFEHMYGVVFGLDNVSKVNWNSISRTCIYQPSKKGLDKVLSLFFLKEPLNTSTTALIFGATAKFDSKMEQKKFVWVRSLNELQSNDYSQIELFEEASRAGLSLKRRYLIADQFAQFLQPFAFYGDLLHMVSNAETLTSQTLIFISRQCIDLVDKLHELGIYHRDIKPQNFLVDDDKGVLKLYINGFKFATKREKSTQILGSYEYLPLDHKLSSKVRLKEADIFSLGLTIITLCTGQFFSDLKDPSLIELERNPARNWFKIEDEYEKIIYSNPLIPHSLKEILVSFLKIHPLDRLPLKEALSQLK